MDVFLKITGAVLVTVVLYLTVSKVGKDIAVLLTLTGCCIVLFAAVSYLQPVFAFINRLQQIGGLDHELVSLLMKSVGIGMISEITALICSDAGNASVGKTLQILATAVILWISLPVFDQLLDLLNNILGAL